MVVQGRRSTSEVDAELGRVVVVEEEDEHGFVTSTFSDTKKKNRPHHWSAAETVTFYRSLRQ
eukprot:scaffold108514_cov20-Attheya_sp.AAC.1